MLTADDSSSHTERRRAAIAKKADDDAAYRHSAQLLLGTLLPQQRMLTSLEQRSLVAALLSRASTAHEREAVSRYLVDALLRVDDVATCTVCFPTQALNVWVMEHADFAFDSCPATVALWTQKGSFGSALILSRAAARMEHASDEAKRAILAGNAPNRLHRHVPILLGQGLAPWSTLSPAWIGPPGSALREVACSLGWLPHHLMGMMFSTIWDKPEHWLDNVRYPYSIVVCKWILAVMENDPLGKDPDGYFCTTLAMSAKTNCLDAALAECILEYSPVPLVYTLARHPAIACMDSPYSRVISAVVGLRVNQGNIAALAQELCEGRLFPESMEAYGVEGLV